jgi:hypothetical protein
MEHMGMKIIKINKAQKQNPRSENHTAESMTGWLSQQQNPQGASSRINI